MTATHDDTLDGLDTWLDHGALDTVVEDGLDTVQEVALPPEDQDATTLNAIDPAPASAD